MAQETIGELMIRMGLSYDELNQDFVAVEETLSANIERLNRENRLIQLKANIDLVGATEAAEKLKIQQEALTKQIELQAQKVKLYEAEWRSAAKANGEASKQAQKAEIALRQQEMALEKLKQKLQAVTAQQQEFGKGAASGAGGGILDVLSNIKGDISGGVSKLANTFGELKEASGSAGGALSKAIELISGIPSPAGKAVAALAAIPLVIKGIENSILSVTEAAMTQGDSFYVFSRGLQVSIDEAKELSMVCKVTGIEISEVAATTKRVATSFLRAGDNTNLMTKTLQRYGVELKNSNGEMKNTLEMSKALAAGLAKAQAEGQGKEFIASVFGRFASGDYITYLEDLAGNIEFAKKVIKNGLEDPVLAHSVQGEMNALNAQIDEAGNAFSYALLPVANKIIPELREQFGALTKVIADNAEGIKAFGEAAAAVLGTISAVTTKATVAVVELVGALGELASNKAQKDRVLDKYLNNENIKSLEDLVNAELQRNYTYTERVSIESNPALYQQTLRHYEPMFSALEEARKKVKEKAEEIKVELGSVADFSAIKQEHSKLTDEAIKAVRAELKATETLSDELYKLKHNEYENRKFDLMRWAQDLLNAESTTAEQRELIHKIYAEKSAKIEEDRANKLANIRESVAEADRTALENKLAALDKEVEAWISAGMSEIEALELAERKKQHIRAEYAEKAQALIQDAADREYSLTHNAFEKQLYDIESWKQAQLEKAQTAEEVSATIADAAMKEAEAFKRAIDQMQDAVRSIQDDIARKTMSPKAYDEYAAQKKYREYLEKYPKSVADEWFRVEMARIGKKAADEEERYHKAIAAEEERYRQARQRGDDAERRVIENPYTKSPGFGTSPLVNADSRALAAMGVLEKYGISVEELQKELNSTATAKEAYQNILQRLNDKMRETSGELGDATTEATNGIGNLGDAATEGADKITSAAETVRRAFEYLAEIEEENARRKRDFQPEDEEPKIPIIYGDEFDTYAPSIPPDKRIPIEYGNEDYIPPSTFEGPLQSAAEKIREFADNMDSAPIENFQQEVQQATDSVTDSAGATQNLADAATTAGTSTNALSEKMLQTADMLDALREKIANTPLQQPPQQPQQYDNFSDAIDDALKATATIGELTALGGLATLQPQIALLGTGIEALANTAQTLRDLAKHVPAQPTPTPTTPQPATPQPQPNSPTSVDLSEIQTTLTTIQQAVSTIAQEPPVDLAPLQEGLQQLAENPALAEINTSIQGMSTELSAKLAEIAQGISALAQSAGNNRQPPQVNVNVSPNINLGGAYVFDNAMKQQLTDDIATEVADAVTSAVQTATKQADYGYGN